MRQLAFFPLRLLTLSEADALSDSRTVPNVALPTFGFMPAGATGSGEGLGVGVARGVAPAAEEEGREEATGAAAAGMSAPSGSARESRAAEGCSADPGAAAIADGWDMCVGECVKCGE